MTLTALPRAFGALTLVFALAACGDSTTGANSDGETATPAGGLDAPTTAVSDTTSPAVEAGVYAIDPVHSEVGFRVRHLGISNVDGTLSDVAGTLTLGAGGLASMQTEATIQATSIDTENDQRDNHLRSADFFDVEQFPTLTFRSTRVEPTGAGRFRMTGDLTMHGVTRPITLEGEYAGLVTDGMGNRKVGFMAEGTLNRSEFGLNWNQALETGGVVVSDEVRLTLEIQAALQAEEAAAADSTAAPAGA